MKIFQLRGLSKRLAILGAMGLMAVGALVPAVAFAATTQSSKCAPNDTKCVIAAGDQLITNRLNSLDNLSKKITQDQTEQKITSDQANALQADVTTNENGLKSLKTKLDGETDPKAARTDVENIFQQFRIYAVVLPRDNRHLLLDIDTNVRQLMVNAEPAIQTAIANAPADKQDQLKTLYSDYQKQLADAGTQIDTANQDLPQLTPENFDQNRTSYQATFKNLNDALKATSKDLHQAAKDLHDMVKIVGHDIQ